jgi:hypothetical protein
MDVVIMVKIARLALKPLWAGVAEADMDGIMTLLTLLEQLVDQEVELAKIITLAKCPVARLLSKEFQLGGRLMEILEEAVLIQAGFKLVLEEVEQVQLEQVLQLFV